LGRITDILSTRLKPLGSDAPDCYLVGGAVRDHLLGRPTKDIDIASSDPKRLASLIARDRNAAIVAFREETDKECFRVVDRDSPDVFVDIAPVRGTAISDDLLLRDFTVNAMAIRLGPGGEHGEVIDPLNGADDIKNQMIRATGPETFLNDPLRILRAFRLAAELDFTVESSTLSAIKKSAALIATVSSERILVELLGIFNAKRASYFIKMMDELGVIDAIFPEAGPMKGCGQNSCHHLDVWDHSMMTMEYSEDIINNLQNFFEPVHQSVANNLNEGNRLPLIKLAALFHDVAKPQCRSNGPAGAHLTFYGHAEKGTEIMEAIASRLKMSNQDRDFLCAMIAEHMHLLSLSRPEVKTSTLMRWFRKLGDDIIALIILEMADTMATLGPDSDAAEQENFIEWSKKTVAAYYGRIKTQLGRQDLIRGKDLIAIGMSPGPQMGRVLKEIRQAQDAGEVKNRDEAIRLASGMMLKFEVRRQKSEWI
jgi:tRNA nucleotidyltransferase/poly(A) polymerase